MLLREGVTIRDMETILVCLGDLANNLKDIEVIVEYVRQSLKRTITRRFADGGSLRVITLDPKVEDIILQGVKKSGSGSSVVAVSDKDSTEKEFLKIAEKAEYFKMTDTASKGMVILGIER